MKRRLRSVLAASLFAAWPGVAPAGDTPAPASDEPSKVAATRLELKEQLERSKESHPRLPLPPPTEEEIAAAKARAANSTAKARPGHDPG